MQSPSLVLVFAQSGRFIAESATRAGFTVRVADCFGDVDTLRIAERWQPLPTLSELTSDQLLAHLVALSNNQACWLVCGTGIERFYPILSQLPEHIQFAGNLEDSFALLRRPESFFSLLHSLELPYPEISFSVPKKPYLLKDMAGSGGYTIQTTSSTVLTPTQYYQRYIDGESYSVCFIADGQKAQLLGWNQQKHRTEDFTLVLLTQPAYPPEDCQPVIIDAVSKLVEACGLQGLNSLDYLVDKDGHAYILELNPRISASAELLPHTDIFNWHLQACLGQLPKIEPPAQSSVRMLHYLFAEHRLNIAEDVRWPQTCHDLPSPSSTIEAGMPICTLIVDTDNETACQQKLNENIIAARQNCHTHA